MKDIKDYLHLYFYSEIEITEVFINVGYKVGQRFTPTGGEIHLALRENPVFACKPILRRLSDMSEEEAKECWAFAKAPSYRFVGFDGASRSIFYKNGNGNPGGEVMNKPHQFHYLLSKSFDLFGLIDAGLAIDEKTLTN